MQPDTAIPGCYLNIGHVEKRIAGKKSWIHEQVRLGRFPAPDDGRWFESEINAYLHAQRTGKFTGRTPYQP